MHIHNDLILFIPVIILVLLFMFGVKINRAGTELNNSSLRQAGNIFILIIFLQILLIFLLIFYSGIFHGLL